MSSHADSHDRDKLARYHKALGAPSGHGFPVCALFLVSPEDRHSHGIFRQYRDSFEARSAGFEHLIIFGQHGVSTTLLALLGKLSLPRESAPLLVCFPWPDSGSYYTLPLPKGDGPSQGEEGSPAPVWQEVLSRVEQAADRRMETVFLEMVPGLTYGCLVGESLVDLVEELQERV